MESRWLTFARILSMRTATTYAATTVSAAPTNNLSNLLCFKGNPLFHFQQSAFSTVARVARLFTKNFLWRTRKQHGLGARAILARGAYQAAAVIQPREPIRALKDHWQYAGNFSFACSDSCTAKTAAARRALGLWTMDLARGCDRNRPTTSGATIS